MLNYVYEAFKKKINLDVPEVLQVDWFYNQYENTEEGNLVWTTPSVYVEFLPVQWTQRGRNYQVATIQVIFHVVSASGFGAEDYRQTHPTDGLVITHLDLCQRLFLTFQKFTCAYDYLPQFPTEMGVLINEMIRTSTEVSHELSVFNVTRLTFSLNIQDLGAMPERIEVAAPIAVEVTGEVVAELTNQ